jgi:hypothetical protein
VHVDRGGFRNVSTFALVGACGLFAAACALVAFDLRYHEYWRDEVHAALLSASVPLHRFLLAKRIEGPPFALDLLTLVFREILSPEWSLLLAGAIGYSILLFGTYRCIVSISCRRVASLVVTALFAGTYVYAYEFGIVIRAYGLGAGLALLTNAYLRDALRQRAMRPVVLGTVAGGLCAISSTHAATFAAGSFVAFALVAVWRDRGIRSVLPTLGALPLFALVAYLALPFPGRSPDLNADEHRPGELFGRLALQAVSGGFTPQDWWVAASFGSPVTLDVIAMLRHAAVIGVALGVAYSVLVRIVDVTDEYREYRPALVYDLLSIGIGWLPLLEIVINHYWGSPRHHAFFGIPVVVALAGWGLQRPFGASGLARWLSSGALVFASPWFAFQLVLCTRDVDLDIRLPFSDTKEAARMLPPGAHVVADSLTTQEGYMFWRPGIVMRGADEGGRHLEATVFDSAWHIRVPLAPLVRQECADAPDRTYYSGAKGSVGAFDGCLRLLHRATPASEQLRADERLDLWQVNCQCVAAPSRP